jgi:peptidoglycan glycosyltransferase
VNRPIRNLYLVVVALFALLLGYTSWWTVFHDEPLRASAQNNRDLIRASRVPRGKIVAADGTVLARSARKKSRSTGDTVYERRYPKGADYVAPVGLSDINLGQTGLERSQNEWLSGKAVKLATAVDRLIQGDQRGDDVQITLEPKVQQAALDGLAGRPGAVVAMEPSTGRILAMASVPGYDPNKAIADSGYRGTLKDGAESNRTTQGAYPPGSTFKVVTAAAALDSGKYTPDSTVDGSNGQIFSGTPLNNFGGESPGDVSLRYALTHSINTAFGNVAEDLGARTMQRYMARFGFGEAPPLDYPESQRRPSGSFVDGKFVPATNGQVDIARLGIGQDKLQVTPLQMAMVVAAVANDGVLMRPELVDKIVDADGRVQKQVKPEELGRVMKASSARELQSMMADVVNEGTGTAFALEGIATGGKTGTAELGDPADGINDLWFIGFAPIEDPKVAVAVVVERTPGTGGDVAAPIAKQVMQAAL